MRRVLLHTIMLGSLFLAGLVVLPQPLDARITKDISIPFQVNNGLIILQAEIDGQQGNFILDTGADAIIINGMPQAAGERLNTVNGEVHAASTQLDHLKIGSFVRYSVDAQITSLSQLEKHLGIDLYGIIGGKFFMPSVLIMDFSTAKLTISSSAIQNIDTKEMDRLNFKMVNNIPMVMVEIEGKSYPFALDSGASVHFIDPKYKDLFSSSLKPLDIESDMLTVNKRSRAEKRYALDHFALGKLSFIGQHFLSRSFDDVNNDLKNPIAGIISLSSLDCSKVVFDLKKRVLYLQANTFRP